MKRTVPNSKISTKDSQAETIGPLDPVSNKNLKLQTC